MSVLNHVCVYVCATVRVCVCRTVCVYVYTCGCFSVRMRVLTRVCHSFAGLLNHLNFNQSLFYVQLVGHKGKTKRASTTEVKDRNYIGLRFING